MKDRALPFGKSHIRKIDYLEHLGATLRYLLPAAMEWHVQNELGLEISGYEVQVYAADSVFLRARTLFEFFTNKWKENGDKHNYHSCKEYGVPLMRRSRYLENNWCDILHSFVIHLQDRDTPQTIKDSKGKYRNLKEMPFEFTKEIVGLWENFIQCLDEKGEKDLADIARRWLNDARNA
jgi:hypothetical protein